MLFLVVPVVRCLSLGACRWVPVVGCLSLGAIRGQSEPSPWKRTQDGITYVLLRYGMVWSSRYIEHKLQKGGFLFRKIKKSACSEGFVRKITSEDSRTLSIVYVALVLYGMVWYGMVWYGMVWYGWYGTIPVWYGTGTIPYQYGMVGRYTKWKSPASRNTFSNRPNRESQRITENYREFWIPPWYYTTPRGRKNDPKTTPDDPRRPLATYEKLNARNFWTIGWRVLHVTVFASSGAVKRSLLTWNLNLRTICFGNSRNNNRYHTTIP